MDNVTWPEAIVVLGIIALIIFLIFVVLAFIAGSAVV